MIKMIFLFSLIEIAIVLGLLQQMTKAYLFEEGIKHLKQQVNEIGKKAEKIQACREETGNNTQCIIDVYGFKNQTEIELGLKTLTGCDIRIQGHC